MGKAVYLLVQQDKHKFYQMDLKNVQFVLEQTIKLAQMVKIVCKHVQMVKQQLHRMEL